MYEKRSDRILSSADVISAFPVRKTNEKLMGVIGRVAKYSAYVLAVVLSLLVVFLIMRTVALSPEAGYVSPTPQGTNEAIATELGTVATSAIVPRTGVFYHGVKLGEYEGDNVTISDIIDHFSITLDEHDVLSLPLDTTVSYGMTLEIDSVTYVEEIIEEVIPYQSVTIETQTIPKGTTKIKTEGVNGSSQKVIRTKHVNGEATDEAVNFDRYTAPVTEEILKGVGGTFLAPDGKSYNYSYYLDVTATAYTHTGDPTYMGTVAEVGVIAVDPRNIDLGSKVYVTGNYGDYGVCRAEDIGGGIKGLRIDVFLDTEEECVLFGRRKMRAYVLE